MRIFLWVLACVSLLALTGFMIAFAVGFVAGAVFEVEAFYGAWTTARALTLLCAVLIWLGFWIPLVILAFGVHRAGFLRRQREQTADTFE